MTFQKTTTYEQSLKLKEAGAQTSIGFGDRFYEYDHRHPYRWDVECDGRVNPSHCVRAFTRQELEDWLMGRGEVVLWSLNGSSMVYLDPVISCGAIEESRASFNHDTNDPFPAIFDAVVFSLQEQNEKH